MPPTKKREKNAERIKVLEEFGFAIATPPACAIADAVIALRKEINDVRLSLLARTAPNAKE
jgi:hypothetical protein